jgi:hypothetical protein
MSVGHRLLFATILGITYCGCSKAPQSPREAFLAEITDSRSDYVQVYEVSIESLQELEDEVLKATKLAVRGVRDVMKEEALESRALSERLERMEHVAEMLRRDRMHRIEQLKENYNPKTDTILFYHRKSEMSEEMAWIVMTGCEIKRRIVLLADEFSSN